MLSSWHRTPILLLGLLLICKGPGWGAEGAAVLVHCSSVCGPQTTRTRSSQPPQALPSSCPGHPENHMPPTSLPFLSLLPAKPISVSPRPLVVSLLLEPVGAQLPS